MGVRLMGYGTFVANRTDRRLLAGGGRACLLQGVGGSLLRRAASPRAGALRLHRLLVVAVGGARRLLRLQQSGARSLQMCDGCARTEGVQQLTFGCASVRSGSSECWGDAPADIERVRRLFSSSVDIVAG